MTENPFMLAFGMYTAIALAGVTMLKRGLELIAAGFVGIALTTLHGIVAPDTCNFDNYNAVASIVMLLLFLFVYFARGVRIASNE